MVVPDDGHVDEPDHPDDLKVVMVANLLLLGSQAGYFNAFFRNYYLSKFFRVKFHFFVSSFAHYSNFSFSEFDVYIGGIFCCCVYNLFI